MKNKKDEMKKLALMGIATGMLLSVDSVEASFLGDASAALDTSSYLAAGCGAGKCGGGRSQGNVANRDTNGNYYYRNSCKGMDPSIATGDTNTQGNTQANTTSQGFYDASHGDSNQHTNQYQPGMQGQSRGQNYQQGCHAQTNRQNTQQGQQNYQQGTQQLPSANQNQNPNYQANSCSGNSGSGGGCGARNNNSGTGGGCGARNNNSNNGGYYNPQQVAEASTHVTTGHLNEADLLSKLTGPNKEAYNSLSPEGKKLALQLANQDCKGHNECKGLNSCKTDKNECAGKGGCKGQSKGPFLDKNLAVTVAASAKMADKRNGLQKTNGK